MQPCAHPRPSFSIFSKNYRLSVFDCLIPENESLVVLKHFPYPLCRGRGLKSGPDGFNTRAVAIGESDFCSPTNAER